MDCSFSPVMKKVSVIASKESCIMLIKVVVQSGLRISFERMK